MNAEQMLPFTTRFELTDSTVRQDGTATFDFELVDRGTGELVDLQAEFGCPDRAPNRGSWVMVDVSPN